MLPAVYVYVFRADCLGLNDLSGVHPLEKKNDFLYLSSCCLPVALPLGVEPVRLPHPHWILIAIVFMQILLGKYCYDFMSTAPCLEDALQ